MRARNMSPMCVKAPNGETTSFSGIRSPGTILSLCVSLSLSRTRVLQLDTRIVVIRKPRPVSRER